MGFSFEQVNATDYDELRPTYAPEAVRWVAERARLEPGSLVVDVAAGTGQLSRRFASLGVRVVAMDTGGLGLTWIGFIVLAVIGVSALFKSAKRSHLD